jgi:uncharacterized protein (UPF0303 family)
MTQRWDPIEVIADVEAQERELVFESLDHDDAWDLGSLVVGMARARELPIAVAIDLRGQRAFTAGLPGSTSENDSWINRKIRTVRDFGESSFLVGRRIEARGEAPDEALDTIIYAGHCGAFPLRINGESAGILVISGLPQEEDHALAVECIRLYLQASNEKKSTSS